MVDIFSINLHPSRHIDHCSFCLLQTLMPIKLHITFTDLADNEAVKKGEVFRFCWSGFGLFGLRSAKTLCISLQGRAAMCAQQ